MDERLHIDEAPQMLELAAAIEKRCDVLQHDKPPYDLLTSWFATTQYLPTYLSLLSLQFTGGDHVGETTPTSIDKDPVMIEPATAIEERGDALQHNKPRMTYKPLGSLLPSISQPTFLFCAFSSQFLLWVGGGLCGGNHTHFNR